MKSEKEESMSQMHNEWLKHQNVWQQIRHGVSGPWGRHGYWWLVLCGKAFVLVALAAAAVFYLLPIYTKSAQYKKVSCASLENALCLRPGDAHFKLVSRNIRDWMIPAMQLKGNEQTFFKHLSMKGVRGEASLLAGLMGTWKPYSLTIDSLDILTQNEALPGGTRYENLCSPFWVRNLSIKSLRLRWAQNNFSSWLDGASCDAAFEDGHWLLHLKGGVLHSSMFPNCRLVDARVVLAPGEKIQIESCLLQVLPASPEERGVAVDLQGTVSWENGGPARFDVRMQSRNIELRHYLSTQLGQMIRGTFAAEGSLKGPFHSPTDWVGRFRFRNQGDVEILNVALLQKLDEILGRRSFRSLICPEVSFDATYSYDTGNWRADSILARSDSSDDVEIKGELSSRHMTDAEWKDICKQLPEAGGGEVETGLANMFFTSGVEKGDGSGIVKRTTPILEGHVSISLPVSSLNSVVNVMQELFETRQEGDRLTVVLPICGIASEATRKEAEALRLRSIHRRTESRESEK